MAYVLSLLALALTALLLDYTGIAQILGIAAMSVLLFVLARSERGQSR
jgi:hypothetical protein